MTRNEVKPPDAAVWRLFAQSSDGLPEIVRPVTPRGLDREPGALRLAFFAKV